MFIKEYRIPLPLNLKEYRKGQLFAVAQASRNETGGGEGVEVVKQENFTDHEVNEGEKMSGVYTYKIYRIKSKVPGAARRVLPDGAFVLHEECWNAYPYCKTVVTNPDYMGEKFYIKIESMHISDRGETANALNLKGNMKNREVVFIDIYDDKYLKSCDITEENDVRIFKSRKTGRGPLTKDWLQTAKPVMCCYKVVEVQFKWFGLQKIIENTAHRTYPRLFCKHHRETFCWIDQWYDLTPEDIQKFENATREALKKQMAEAEKRGFNDELDAKATVKFVCSSELALRVGKKE